MFLPISEVSRGKGTRQSPPKPLMTAPLFLVSSSYVVLAILGRELRDGVPPNSLGKSKICVHEWKT